MIKVFFLVVAEAVRDGDISGDRGKTSHLYINMSRSAEPWLGAYKLSRPGTRSCAGVSVFVYARVCVCELTCVWRRAD